MRFFDHQTGPSTSVSEYRQLAKRRLPCHLFDFIDGGAFNEVTLRLNCEDYQRVFLRKRVLRDVSNVDTSTEIFGQKLSLPLVLAPVGFAGIFARRGEVQAARAAERHGVPFSLSSLNICPAEEVKNAISAPFWYQYYLLKDKALALDLLNRVKSAGCPVLLLTVDLPAIGARHRYNRSVSQMPFMKHFGGLFDSLLHPQWFVDVRLRGGPIVLGDISKLVPHLKDLPSMRQWMRSQLNSAMTWKDLEWIRSNWPGKIVLKGIMDPEDARYAAESGVDGIVVSNHGARHLDGTPSTISVLPKIVEAVDGRLDILIDGGISSGLDIVKALALGAKACMIGRAWAFALAAHGEEGVSEVIRNIHNELKVAMVQLGVTNTHGINRNLIDL